MLQIQQSMQKSQKLEKQTSIQDKFRSDYTNIYNINWGSVNISPVRCRLYCSEEIVKKSLFGQDFGKIDFEGCVEVKSSTIIIYAGGSAFIPSLQHLQREYLKEWAKKLKIPIFDVCYKISEKRKFPGHLNDLITAYKNIVWYYKFFVRGGVRLERIIVVGDSIGGNLVAGLINYLVATGFDPLPSQAIYFYPGKKHSLRKLIFVEKSVI